MTNFKKNQVLFLSLFFLCFISGKTEGRCPAFNSVLTQVASNGNQNKSDLLVPGKIVSFRTSGTYGITYHVYTPYNYNKNTPPPMLIGFSAGGGGKSILERFQPAIEEMGWIGVGCDTLRNGMPDFNKEIEIEDELLDEILAVIPHQSKRVYLTGGSGGAMRAYGITARRPEKYAGILAHGGWLGGASYQNKTYPAGMHIAMLNGNLDMGAGGWTVTDTKTLRSNGCTVKHFTCMGGHMVAPADVTLIAMQWLEEQWNKSEWEDASKIPLKVLCVGDNKTRINAYQSFLATHFISVKAITTNQVTLALTNEADILLLDDAVYTLPDNYNKAMLLIGGPALETGKRFGSKMGPAVFSKDPYFLQSDTLHALFNVKYQLSPSLQINSKGAYLVNRPDFDGTKDAEIVLECSNNEGTKAVLALREASRLFWGNESRPDEMNEGAQKLFINALLWIFQFDGTRQISYSGITPRDSIAGIIAKIDLKSNRALRWFPEGILQQCDYDKQKLNAYYQQKLPYIYTNYGSGQLCVDNEVSSLKTPNNELASIQLWINELTKKQGKKRGKYRSLLIRYTNQFIRNGADWQKWFTTNKDKLAFSDESGYVFELNK